MLEEYSVRSSDATIDIVYSDFNDNSDSICNNDSDLISIISNDELDRVLSILTAELYKKIFIICSVILFILVLILLYFHLI